MVPAQSHLAQKGRGIVKRAELYAWVWEKPVTHVARELGVSDVAVRKTCRKHGIPLPPLGYWAKLQHGKKVVQTPLPPAESERHEKIDIRLPQKPVQPPEIAEALQSALEEEAPISFPVERPEKLHPIAAATEKVLRKAKIDDEGFAASSGEGKFNVYVGPASVDRATLLVHFLILSATERHHSVPPDTQSQIFVDEQPLAVRIYETKAKAAHVPTQSELKRQAEQDESRRRYPSLYSGNHKTYRSWDYYPSGRLMLEIFDLRQQRWKGDPLVGRWRDTSARRLEDRVAEMMAALKTGGATAHYHRAKEAEEARLEKEANDRRREHERQRRLLDKVTKFMMDKADQYAKLSKLEDLAAFLGINGADTGTEEHSELQRAMEFVLVNLRNQLSPSSINQEIVDQRVTSIESWW